MGIKIKRHRRRITGVSGPNRVLPTATKASGYTDGEAAVLLQKYSDMSNIVADPFENDYGLADTLGGSIVVTEPDRDLAGLAHIVTVSNILHQCIESMVTNTTSYGYMLEYIGPEGEEKGKAQQAEKRRLTALLSDPSPGESLRAIMEKASWDRETLGYRAFELIRADIQPNSEIIGFNHVPSISLRKTRPDRTPTRYEVSYFDEETGDFQTKMVAKRFRRFVQRSGTKTVYFKEAGDPRIIDNRDGTVMRDFDERYVATEILWDEFYSPGKNYGQPRWIGVLPEILGSRESVMVNLNFFRENAIPAMAVLVSGGALTADSYENLVNYITAARGPDAMHRVMVLESSNDEGTVDRPGPAPRIEMKPMISERQQDGLFKDYDIHNITKVRSVFRLPPILVGKAEDYTRASAFASIETAENQVFIPERTRNDELINSFVLSSYSPRYWRYRSLGPQIVNAEDLANIVDKLGAQGALTPNVVIKLANKMLGVFIQPVLDDWGDYPFDLIQSMVEKGYKIKGLSDFVDGVMEQVQTTPAVKEPPTTAPARVKPTPSKVVPLNRARAASAKKRLRSSIHNQVSRLIAA